MTAFVVKNASFWISKGSPTVAVTTATPGEMTELTIANTLAVGDYAVVSGSGWPSLDGKIGKVTVASPSSITVDIDTSAETAPFGTSAKASLLGAAEWLELCLSGFDRSGGAADSVSVGTFCDSTAALAGAPAAASLSLSGFIDLSSLGYLEALKASSDGLTRFFKFVYPKAALPEGSVVPELVFQGTVGAVDESYQVGAAATFTAPVVLASTPRLVK